MRENTLKKLWARGGAAVNGWLSGLGTGHLKRRKALFLLNLVLNSYRGRSRGLRGYDFL